MAMSFPLSAARPRRGRSAIFYAVATAFLAIAPVFASPQPTPQLRAFLPIHVGSPIDVAVDELLPRQQTTALSHASSSATCPAGYYSCSGQGNVFEGTCCPLGQACELDSNNEPACCPSGDVCTGQAPSAGPTITASTTYIPDYQYGSFPYIYPLWVAGTSTLANAAACDEMLNLCHREMAACTARLAGIADSAYSTISAVATVTVTTTGGATPGGVVTATTTLVTPAAATTTKGNGGGYGVTVVVSDTTTVVGGAAKARFARAVSTTYAMSSAASICSSLSTQACGGLPTDAAGCASSYRPASTVTVGATGGGGGSSNGAQGGLGSSAVAANRAAMLVVAAVVLLGCEL